VYNEVTPFDEKSEPRTTNAMRIGTKERATELISKMMKLLAMENPFMVPNFLKRSVLF